MSKKSISINSLKTSLTFAVLVMITACASNNSDDWPKLEADNLWQQLEQGDGISKDVVQKHTAENDMSLLKPPFGKTTLSLEEVRVTLNEIERDFPGYAENLNNAMNVYVNAMDVDKAMHWRGVEIEKSRINNMASALWIIVFQLASNDQMKDEVSRARVLLKKVGDVTPQMPDDMDMKSAINSPYIIGQNDEN